MTRESFSSAVNVRI